METTQERGAASTAVSLTDTANAVLGALYANLSRNTAVEFGSGMLCLSDSSILSVTLAHRVLNKFQVPTRGHEQALRRACYDQWVQHEESLASFDFDAIPLHVKSVLYRARQLLATWFGDFRADRNTVSFTPGETYVSAAGKVSVFQKLSNRDAWCVTHDALEDFTRLCYNNLSLKRCAKALMPQLSSSQRTALHMKFRNEPHVGFACFSFLFRTFVVTVVNGSRASTVPKNNKEVRFINVEPLGNMILQRSVALPMRDVLRLVGNDLEIGQQLHRARIADPNVATVDFSKASDSVVHEVCNRMFPASVSKLLTRYRSPMTQIDGVDYVPRKLSSMGCGFTFEVMTSLLLAVARVLDPAATVYGDDVIIDSSCAAQFAEVTGFIRFKVNQKKTFIDSRFRESCGGFFLDGYGHVRCYDFHYCENLNDVLITVNKLFLILRDSKFDLDPAYREAYEALSSAIPALHMGYNPLACEPDLGYALCEGARKKHMRSVEVAPLRKRFDVLLERFAKTYCVLKTEILLVSSPKFVPTLVTKTTRDLKDQGARYSSYLYSGRVAPDSKRNSGKWVTHLQMVHPSGFVLSLKYAKELETQMTGRKDFVGPPTQHQHSWRTGLN